MYLNTMMDQTVGVTKLSATLFSFGMSTWPFHNIVEKYTKLGLLREIMLVKI